MAPPTARDAAPSWAAAPPPPEASAPMLPPTAFPFAVPGRATGPSRKTFVAIAAALGIVTVATVAVAVHRGRGASAPEPVKSVALAVPDPPPPAPSPGPAATTSIAPTRLARLTVTCTPGCDAIEIDGRSVETFPMDVEPGSHSVVGRRGSHPAQKKNVTTSETKPTDVTFIWGTARPAAPKPPKKPCGKFLQRCD
jgi:hypothetical protein